MGASWSPRGTWEPNVAWEPRGRFVGRGSLWDVGASWASMAKPILVTSVKNHVSICNSGKFGDNLQHVGRPRHIVCKRANAC